MENPAKNVESALAEHNNGKIGIKESRVGVDAFATIGQEFVLRVVNAAWWGHYLIEKNDRYTGSEDYHRQIQPLELRTVTEKHRSLFPHGIKGKTPGAYF